MTSFGACRGAGTPAINDKTDMTSGQYIFFQDWTFTNRFQTRETRPGAPVAGSRNLKGTEIGERIILANYYPCIGAGGWWYYEHRIISQTPIDLPDPHQDIAPAVTMEAVDYNDRSSSTELFEVTPSSGCSLIDGQYGGDVTLAERDFAVASGSPQYNDGNALIDGYVLVGQPPITQAGIRKNGGSVEPYGATITITPSSDRNYRAYISSGIKFVPYRSVIFRVTTTIESWAHVEAGAAVVRLAGCLPL